MKRLGILICFAVLATSFSGCKDKKTEDELASEEIIDTKKKKKKKSRFKSVQGTFNN